MFTPYKVSAQLFLQKTFEKIKQYKYDHRKKIYGQHRKFNHAS